MSSERVAAWPWLTAGMVMLVAATALLALATAGVRQALQYDRAAVIEGEYWRLLSSHLVHFSHMHLAANLCAFAALSALVERSQGLGALALLLAWLAVAAGAVLPLFARMQYYGGLSAMCYGLLAWVCLTRLRFGRPMLIAIMAHALWQGATGRSVGFAVPAGTVVAWQVHLACMVGAGALSAVFRPPRGFSQWASSGAAP